MKTTSLLLEDFTSRLEDLNYAARTVESYRDECRLFIAWMDSNHGIDTSEHILKGHLLAWQKYLAACRNPKGRPLAPKTVNRKISSVRAFLNFLVMKGHMLEATVAALKLVREPQFLPAGVLDHGKMKKILAKIPTATPTGYRNRAMLELLYSTAIRARELLGLDLSGVNLENRTVTVLGKGRKERVVPVGRTAMRFLETYVNAVRPFLAKSGRDPALFLNINGTRLAYDSFRRIVHKFCDGNADFNITPHTFRRSCTTEMIKGGANIYHVKEMLGHESIETLKPYIKLTITDLKKTHEKCHPREKDSR